MNLTIIIEVIIKLYTRLEMPFEFYEILENVLTLQSPQKKAFFKLGFVNEENANSAFHIL